MGDESELLERYFKELLNQNQTFPLDSSNQAGNGTYP